MMFQRKEVSHACLGCRLRDEENLARSQVLESKWLAKCLLAYIKRNRGELGTLFDLLDIFGAQTRVSFVFMRTFLSETIPTVFSLDERRQVGLPFSEKGCCQNRRDLLCVLDAYWLV